MNRKEREEMLVEDKKRRKGETSTFIKQELEAILEYTSDQLNSGVYFGNEPGETSGGWSLVSPSACSRLVFDNPCGYWCSEWMNINLYIRNSNYDLTQLSMFMYADYEFDDSTNIASNNDETDEFLKAHPEVADLVLKVAKIVYDHSITHPEEKE